MQRQLFIIFLVFTASFKVFAQRTEDVLVYIETYKEMAMSEMKRTGIPAAIKLAQGIHETEAGKSDLVKKSNNHFGIKCKATWTGVKVFHDDDARGECFRSYSRPEDSYMDHSDFLKNSSRYAFLFDLDPTDYEAWAYGLKKAGYATNIRYSQVLIRIIQNYQLQDYTLIAMGRMKETDRVLVFNSTGLPHAPVSSEIVKEEPKEEIIIKHSYPQGEFAINNTKVIYVKENRAWLSLAEEYDIPLGRLWDFNDIEKDADILERPQLVYLQRKRKVGATEFHVITRGETLYDICQSEGIRFESLLALNHLKGNMQPAPGEKINLQFPAFDRPLLAIQERKPLPASGPGTGTSLAGAGNDPGFSNKPVTTSASQKELQFTTHLVSTKETLYSISKRYGVELEKIKEWNRLEGLDLKIGQELIIYKNN